jgi:hypothetical protein
MSPSQMGRIVETLPREECSTVQVLQAPIGAKWCTFFFGMCSWLDEVLTTGHNGVLLEMLA